MPEGRDRLLDRIRLLAADLPGTVAEDVARAIEQAPPGNWSAIRRRLTGAVAHPRYRQLASALVDVWTRECPGLEPQSVALALLLAVRTEEVSRGEQVVELVWTGPGADATPLRRTDQALLQLIDGARSQLTIVTFALYRIPRVAQALVRAAERGVALRLVAESSQASGGKIAHDGVAALGPAVAEHATVYFWPRERRPATPEGRYGALHVKCAVADDRELFLSSANLTEHALTLNMEMGLLVRGGPLPRRVADHFDRLIQTGVLVETPATAGVTKWRERAAG